VQVRYAGICGTDLEMVKGYAPFTGILGHEFVGVVASAPGAPEWNGRRVVGEINLACGQCDLCQRGLRSHCRRRQVLGIRGRDGAFAEYLTLPLDNLHAVPGEVPDEAAVFSEPLAAALQIQEQVCIAPGDRVLVIGAGRLGQLVARTLATSRCQLSALARNRNHQELLARAGIENTPALASDLAGSFDLVVECSGNPQGLALAQRAVRPQGVIVLKSTYHGNVQVDMSWFAVNEVSLVGSRCGPFARALNLLSAGQVDVLPLVQDIYPLSAGLAALEAAQRPGAMKILLAP
jgi:threonine dehydrogenase-like Zn-dependent dehydrogenase